jgi:hypothetical protein
MTEAFPMYSFSYRTPDGRVYVFVTETQPVSIRITIGKPGTSVAAWADALTGLVNELLHHRPVDEISSLLDGISSGSSAYNTNGSLCRSTPEAVSFALVEYLQQKRREEKRNA